MSLFRNWLIKNYLWAAGQLYHRFAWAYDFVAWLVSFGNWSKWRGDVLDYLKQGSVLEIGFGTGALLVTMKRAGFDVYGLEPSSQMLRVTERRMKREAISLRILQGRTQAIPISDQSIDNIISTFPSNYIFEEVSLKEIKRVLAVGGRVVITGFGVRFNSRLKNGLTGWFLNDGSDIFIMRFCQTAQDLGFNPTLIQHQDDSYILPVIIMEKEHGK
jgi:ubiquinone/menaquinone biosynthesis C-methylase UbiE